MTHATYTTISTTSPEKFTPGLASPFDPSAVESLRRLSVSEGVKPTFGFRGGEDKNKEVDGGKVVETGKFPGTRGWAARWEKIGVKEGGGEGIKLRGSGKNVNVGLEGGVYAVNGGEGKEVGEDEKFWDDFLDKAEEFAK